MARLHLSILAVCAAALVTASAAAKDAKPGVLPLKRVRLYETGVGYFERSGLLVGQSVGLPVPAGHLDDALKTLVVLGADGKASVSGVEFESSVSRSMARALAGLPADGTAPLGFTELLTTLKGAPVQVRAKGTTMNGRLVDVLSPEQSALSQCEAPKKDDKSKCVMVKKGTLLVLGDDGEIRRFALDDVTSVRPTDPAFSSRLGAALSALSQHGAQTQKTLHVSAASGSPITLGYVAESPIWRSTYRVVLDTKDDSATLQGWALVHNDTDENWKQVKVELVNGRPDSFLFPLAGPRYARRELVTPDHELSSVPQLLDTTVDNMWTGDSEGGLGLTGTGEGGGGYGEGIGLGSIGTIGHGAGTGTSSSASSSLLGVGNLASIQQADGTENGALFRYALAHPVDLRAHGSALVPFLQDSVPARRIAWFAAPGESARSAVRLKNNTHQTLPPGPIAVFAEGGFAGESSLSRTKPSESRLVAFGDDLDVELTLEKETSRDQTRLVSFSGDTLREHYVRHRRLTYALVNRSGSGRTVYLTLDLVNNARVSGADSLDFDTETSKALAVFRLDAHKALSRTLDADEGLSRPHPLASLSSTQLRALAASPLVPASQRAILKEASDYLLESEVRLGALPKRQAELEQVDLDINRMRENVRAVGNAKIAGADKLVKRMLDAEDQAKALRARVTALQTESEEKTNRARATLKKLPRG